MLSSSSRGAASLIALVALGLGPNAVLAADREPPKMRHAPVVEAAYGEQIKVRVALFDPSDIYEATLYYRRAGTRDFLHATLVDTGSDFVGTIPAEVVEGDIEYYLEAYDTLGNGPARRGSPGAPLRIRVVKGWSPAPPAPSSTAATAPEGSTAAASSPAAADTGSSSKGAASAPATSSGAGRAERAAIAPAPSSAEPDGHEAGLPGWTPWLVIATGALGLATSPLPLIDFFRSTRPAFQEAKLYRDDPSVSCPGSEASKHCFEQRIMAAGALGAGEIAGAGVLIIGGVLAMSGGMFLALAADEE